jgi:hypothetical protein
VPEFSSHNVLLPGGVQTAPGFPLVTHSACYQAALSELKREFPEPEGVSVLDLGSLEGGYAAGFAAEGFDVTGVEVRPESHENAVWLKDQLKLPNLHFECDDARNALQSSRKFDVVFCSGLLYHLDKPVAFLKLIGTVTEHMLILNTHVSMQDGHPESLHHPGSGCDYASAVNEGRHGHWYRESISRWDSYGNESSFWLTPKELEATLIEDAGFQSVREIADWREQGLTEAHIPGGAGIHYPDRRMWVAFK